MRFHVLGIGPIGLLVSHHLRRLLSRNHDICLLTRTHSLAKDWNSENAAIKVEHNGVVSTATGFEAEALDDYQDRLFGLVFNESGKPRLSSKAGSSNGGGGNGGGVLAEVQKERKARDKIESLFLTTKAYNSVAVLRQIRHRIRPKSTIVLMQNGGLGVFEDVVSQIYRNPDDRPHFILVSNNHGAWLKSPGHVVHAGIGTIQFGIVPNGPRDFERSYYDQNTPPKHRALRLDDICTVEDDADGERYRSLRNTVAVLEGLRHLQTNWEPIWQMQAALRRKLVVNSVINPLTMLMGCRNGDLFGNPSADRIASRVCSEAAEVFAAEYAASAAPGTDPRKAVHHLLRKARLMDEWQSVAKKTALNISSMLADLRKGQRETEIDYLNGYLARVGTRYNISTPTNALLTDMVKLRSSLPFDSPL